MNIIDSTVPKMKLTAPVYTSKFLFDKIANT